MSFSLILTELFQKQAKKLSKKYISLKDDLERLGEELLQNPTKGISLGQNIYKVRLPISSKGKGKSGGARVITLVKITEEQVFLVCIYDKGKIDNLTKEEIIQILKRVGEI
ncbi:type II toxin-antitoxin system RelE/ParE family toxin [Litoribacter ruber]|uniref:type II toxin-antitoxin system RelE/ParE family toxin n=1 Tax=Litoribacter ruber TaxID=702568 RepID=UPI001BDB5D1B|nr:type II toxin-antitoxin system RelE/ParE family toxin [Litoribacter ruber]MBT0812248.1 type II toxin-antitoxin system RelE/ParE family toxin [Litoribacter ruber]